MDKSIFRKKSIDRISSPEDLNSYMRVTSPSVWLALGAVILILLGAIVWGIFGKIETKVSAVAVSDGVETVCYVSEKNISSVTDDMTVTIDGTEYGIISVGDTPIAADEALNEYALYLGGFKSGEYVYPVYINECLKSGNFASYIVVESISAVYFIFN